MDKTGQIDLARAAPFQLGPLTIEPALRQVSTTAISSETLEPRVMQVLVVLALARGAIVSRDDLIRQCWDGRIVGDDSINRVILRLRRLAAERGGGSFRIETITKVGYRLIGPVSQLEAVKPQLDGARQPHAAAATIRRQPSWRAWAVAGATGLAGAVALAVWFGHSEKPRSGSTLAVAAFASSGMPAGTPETLQSAIVSSVPRERFHAVPGQGEAADYQLTGRLVGSPEGVVLYAELHAPGIVAPIWTPQKHFANNASLSGIASELAWAAHCIIDGANEPPIKSRNALAGWASYCEEDVKVNYNLDREIEALRAATRAEPRFVTAQTLLATKLGVWIMHKGGRGLEPLRDEGLRAVEAAEKLDPDRAQSYLARAYLTRLGDFRSRETHIAKAELARHTGYGFEYQAKGFFLASVGRLREAVDAFDRSLAITPGNPPDMRERADVLSIAGRYLEARPVFLSEVAIEPNRVRLDRTWLIAAITGQDWETARKLIPTVPDDRVRAAIGPLVEALAKGDRPAASSAGISFKAIAVDSASLSGLTVMALAWSGHDVAAIDAAERRFHSVGYNGSLSSLYSPAFASARQTPEFEALTYRIGLFDYWHSSGHRPDFCAAAGAPAMCAKL